MLKDYYEMICLPQWKWIKKHWKGYLVFLALYSTVCIGISYFDDIKEYIQSKFRHEEKES